MPDSPTDLVESLEDLANHLPDPDPTVDVVAHAIAAIAFPGPNRSGTSRFGRENRWPAWVAAAAAVVALVVAAVPTTREAVAELLGIGGVRVRLTGGVPGDLGTRLDLGRPVTLEETDDLLVPAGVGDPAAAYAGRPTGGVTLVWAPSDELPEVLDTGVGLLLTTFPGGLDEPLIEKRVVAGSTLERTTVDGEPAFFIAGAPHSFFYVGPDGNPVEDTARLSANALLWEEGGVTHRLESSLPLAAARRLAESLEPLDR